MNFLSISSFLIILESSYSLVPILEKNRPPYTLINVNLENESQIDPVREIASTNKKLKLLKLTTQLNKRRLLLDSEYNVLRNKQNEIYEKLTL